MNILLVVLSLLAIISSCESQSANQVAETSPVETKRSKILGSWVMKSHPAQELKYELTCIFEPNGRFKVSVVITRQNERLPPLNYEGIWKFKESFKKIGIITIELKNPGHDDGTMNLEVLTLGDTMKLKMSDANSIFELKRIQ